MDPEPSEGADAGAADATEAPRATERADDDAVVTDGSTPETRGDARAGDERALDAADVEVSAVKKAARAKGRPRGRVAAKVSEKKRATGSLGLCVVQWNQKDLSYDVGNKRSEVRVENIVIELTDKIRYGNAGPAVVVMEEIVGRANGGGEKALRKITEGMNERMDFGERDDGEQFRYKLSGVVNPMSARAEQYAVVYNELLVGSCEVDSNFLQSLSQFAPDGRENEGKLRIGDAEIDLSRAREVFRSIAENDGKLGDRFDRLPALFSFPGPRDSPFAKKLHIIAAHSSTGGANKSPHQNMAESIFLQEMCHQAAAQGEYVILVGDFNHDEAENLTHFMWDDDGELYDVLDKGNSSGVSEKQLFEPTRNAFLTHYVRACHKLLPTNVYPFLAGGDAMGKHNDDIWLPKVPGERVYVEGSKKPNPNLFRASDRGVLFEIFDLGRQRLGRVLEVPTRILTQWDKAARDFYAAREFEGRYQPRLNAGARQALNMMLAKVWSDHRPLAVTLKLTDRKQPTPAKSRAVPEEALAVDLERILHVQDAAEPQM